MGFSFRKASVGQLVRSSATGVYGIIAEIDDRENVRIVWNNGNQSLLYGDLCEASPVEFVYTVE